MSSDPSPSIDPRTRQAIQNVELIPDMIADARHTGIHTSRGHGGDVEFAEHRPYEPGDDLRHLDWNALAKSDELLLKQYTSETRISGELFLDASGSMDYGSEEFTKWETARAVSILIASVLINQNDQVRIHTSGEQNNSSDWIGGVSRLTQFLPRLQSLKPKGPTTLPADTRQAPVRQRSLWILVSDFWIEDLEPFLRWCRGMKQRGHDLLLVPTWDPMERNWNEDETVELRDLETGETLLVSPEDREAILEGLNNYRQRLDRLALSVGATTWTFYTDENIFIRFRDHIRGQKG